MNVYLFVLYVFIFSLHLLGLVGKLAYFCLYVVVAFLHLSTPEP